MSKNTKYQAIFKVPCQIQFLIPDIEAETLEQGLATAHDRIHDFKQILSTILAEAKVKGKMTLLQADASDSELLNFEAVAICSDPSAEKPKNLDFKLRLYTSNKSEVFTNWSQFKKEIEFYSQEEAQATLEALVTLTGEYSAGVIFSGPFISDEKGFKCYSKFSDRGGWEIEAYSAIDETKPIYVESWLESKKQAVERGVELVCDQASNCKMVKIIDFNDRSKGPLLCRVIR